MFLLYYPAPINLNYFWNFGIYAILCLFLQIVTGIILAMFYTPEISMAYSSIETVMRNVDYGWLLRYTHANGASVFFIVVYIHTFRGFYYSSFSYPRELLWIVGVLILLLMIVTAFMGYVLPWGQMSFWGATVITYMLTIIPTIGYEILYWLWGGEAINNFTLNRFFSLHYCFPFIIAVLVCIHIILLHKHGSNNPIGVQAVLDKNFFMPYYIVKDIYGSFFIVCFIAVLVFFVPNMLGHPNNYLPANPLVTPPHIVPEWYFLPFYAILRSIPEKVLGVLTMLASILILFIVPILIKPQIRSMRFRPAARQLFWVFLFDCLILGFVGAKPVKFPFIETGLFVTGFYFVYFLVLYPTVIFIEVFFWGNATYFEEL